MGLLFVPYVEPDVEEETRPPHFQEGLIRGLPRNHEIFDRENYDKYLELRHCCSEEIDRTIGPITVQLCNFKLTCHHGTRVMFRSCITSLEDGSRCSLPVQGSQRCSHDSLTTGMWRWAYDFELTLRFNGDERCSIRICDAASSFLGITAQEMSTKTIVEQYLFLRHFCRGNRVGQVYFACTGGIPMISSGTFRNPQLQ